MPLLSVQRIATAYDRIDVIHDLSLELEESRITCILGANGAGKSTLIRSILGLTPPNRGDITFDGASLLGLPTHRIIAKGIACIPEGRKIFPKMSVAQNLRVGAYQVSDAAEIARRADEVYELFPRLKERREQLAGTMSGGEQAMVSIGRGLMAKPRLLIIDEPSLGLSPLYVKENFRIIADICQLGISVLLVEQNVHQTLAISHYGFVLSQGRMVAQGDARSLSEDKEVQAAYFG
ncbi:ABC transporter ATP-binding protein [Pseudomonas sp. TH39(2020)]|uniref:ABC transporter ATP-binding protein n=1 Tax=Pseudomonas sp. TH39(2020) TaxID=2796349 RepID=UPI001912D0F4|nr:ABC transporter ATP-binding protein [Pseudomonas sp. TH39(2020)]MBK5401449.1 ABC transporter ATP-binding protein [Pseudomonas sp. TH39(2020)]